MTAVSVYLPTSLHAAISDVSLPVPTGDVKSYKSPFLRDFWHLNVAMATSNNALVPDPDKEDILASKPLDWPLLHVGLRMCGWGDSQTKYYLVGHPLIWWGGTVSLVIGSVAALMYILRQQRKYADMDPSQYFTCFSLTQNADRAAGEWEHFLYVGKIAVVGWALHFCELSL